MTSSGEANVSHASGEAMSQTCYKAKALSGDAKIASSGEANTSNAFSEATSQAYYKDKAMSGSAKIASSGEANAFNACDEAKLASSKAKHIAFTIPRQRLSQELLKELFFNLP